jgi:CDP-glucose 4,6-dehydratase
MDRNHSFWTGKRVLVTGHTGFKGGWLALWLQRLGAEVIGISLAPNSSPNLFEIANVSEGMRSYFSDVRDTEEISKLIRNEQPEIVFHLAAQPLVRESYREPIKTLATNVMGTVHVLNALREQSCAKVAVMVTTDKVYKNVGRSIPYGEEDTLGGHDLYSASKAASEIVISSYRDSYLHDQGIAVASARAGNVIGGGDWSEDRLIPDAVRAWQAGQVLVLRNPQAIRPWQHVLEPLHAYIRLAEKLWEKPSLAAAYNFGPKPDEAASVRNVIELAMKAYGKGVVHYQKVSDGPYESNWLALDISKAKSLLDISPRWGLTESVQRTMNWYKAYHHGANPIKLCEIEINDFEAVRA